MAGALQEVHLPTPAAIAASIVEYSLGVDGGCDSADAWSAVVSEVCSDVGAPLDLDGPDDDEPTGPTAEEVVAALCRSGALVNRQPPLPPMRPGDPALAVLDEDGEWHAAVIADEAAAAGGGFATAAAADGSSVPGVLVRFLEWPKLQRTKRAHVVPMAACLADDDEEDGEGGACGEGACELCGWGTRLTFHHLVPKSTHAKYVGKSVPPGLPQDAVPTKHYLGGYGVRLCRPCHSVVHRHAPNSVLARCCNTLDSLREADSIAKWVAYARRR